MNTKRRKNSRLRGSRTHGWGMAKKHSGAGNRGGRGNAGTGKRADHKKSKILKLYGNEYFGKHGFRKHSASQDHTTINLYHLSNIKETSIDLGKLGYTKLLGAGKITRKLTITVEVASQRAIEKVQAAGGKITTTSSTEEEQ